MAPHTASVDTFRLGGGGGGGGGGGCLTRIEKKKIHNSQIIKK